LFDVKVLGVVGLLGQILYVFVEVTGTGGRDDGVDNSSTSLRVLAKVLEHKSVLKKKENMLCKWSATANDKKVQAKGTKNIRIKKNT